MPQAPSAVEDAPAAGFVEKAPAAVEEDAPAVEEAPAAINQVSGFGVDFEFGAVLGYQNRVRAGRQNESDGKGSSY